MCVGMYLDRCAERMYTQCCESMHEQLRVFQVPFITLRAEQAAQIGSTARKRVCPLTELGQPLESVCIAIAEEHCVRNGKTPTLHALEEFVTWLVAPPCPAQAIVIFCSDRYLGRGYTLVWWAAL